MTCKIPLVRVSRHAVYIKTGKSVLRNTTRWRKCSWKIKLSSTQMYTKLQRKPHEFLRNNASKLRKNSGPGRIFSKLWSVISETPVWFSFVLASCYIRVDENFIFHEHIKTDGTYVKALTFPKSAICTTNLFEGSPNDHRLCSDFVGEISTRATQKISLLIFSIVKSLRTPLIPKIAVPHYSKERNWAVVIKKHLNHLHKESCWSDEGCAHGANVAGQ